MARPATAQAQLGPGPANNADAGKIEEITVTARRTSENLQKTPISVSVATSVKLDKTVIVDANQLQNITPGLLSAPALAGGGIFFTIRGQTSNLNSITTDQAVGLYFDGIYIARNSGGLFNLVDIERVEVLNGPQGTLFGRNTTGGAISVISKKPTDKLEGELHLRYGNFNAWETTGVLNVPIVDHQFDVRAVFQHTQHQGYAHNLAIGGRLGSDNTDFARLSARIAPDGQPWRLLIQGDYTDKRSDGAITGLRAYTPTVVNGLLVGLCSGPAALPACPYVGPAGDSLANYAYDNTHRNIWDVYNNSLTRQRSKTWGTSATLDVDLSDVTAFKSITGYRRASNPAYQDVDGTPYAFIGSIDKSEGLNLSQHQFSQEVQLSGKVFDSRLKWIVGGFYFAEAGRDYGNNVTVYPLSPVNTLEDTTGRNKSYAGYAQGTFNITDTVRVTGGVRYTYDKRQITLRNQNEFPVASGNFTCTLDPATLDSAGACSASNNAHYHYISYTAGPDWQVTPGIFLYAKTSRAYRSGGFNSLSTADPAALSYKPEKVTDYEVGAKLDLFDRHLRTNGDFFYTNYKNGQRQVPFLLPDGGIASLTQNAASGVIKGFEFDITAIPIPRLEIGFSGTYLDAHYSNFRVSDGAGGTIDVSKTPFSRTPKFAYVVNVDYSVPIGESKLDLHVDWTHRASMFSQPPLNGPGLFAASHPDVGKMPGYGLLGAQVSYSFTKSLDLSVYGRNLLNKQYFQYELPLQDTALGITTYSPGDPRTYGVEATYRF